MKRLENIVEEQKLFIDEKTKKGFSSKQTRDCKANEFQRELLNIKSENSDLKKK